MNPSADKSEADLAIVGAGAAGLTAAIFAAEAASGAAPRVMLLDGARRIGAKILVSGGGRCNVTNDRVAPEDFFGGSGRVVRKVLRAFDERRTVDWMRELGVELKLEPTGKLFPTTDSARTVLDALVRRVRALGVELQCGARVAGVERIDSGFEIRIAGGVARRARRLIFATGGLSIPKSGSDGAGLRMLAALGHRLVPTTPALTPLVLSPDSTPGGRFAEFRGIAMEARLRLESPTGGKLAERVGSIVFTHFGISGPAALDLSRHYLRARLERPSSPPRVTLGHPEFPTPDTADAWLLTKAAASPRRSISGALAGLFPERFARALAGEAGPIGAMTRTERRELALRISRLPLPVVGDRGYNFAEVTAGGVALDQIDPATMESRVVPGLHLCGELLDADGRIGGFNFQWAWASGYLAGRAAARALAAPLEGRP
jgi:hypothetical protein